jgi:hypothetical protein
MSALEGVQVLWEPTVNQGLVRFPEPRGADHDGWTERTTARVVALCEAFFGATTLAREADHAGKRLQLADDG